MTMRSTTIIRDFRKLSVAALGISLVCSACVEADEQADFGTYPGHAVPLTPDNDDAGQSGGSTGSASNGGVTGAGATGSASNGGVTGADANGSANGGSGGVTGGATSASGTTGGVATTGGGTSNSGSSGGGATTGGTTGASSGGMPAGVSSLTFSVLTKVIGGEYAPRNVGAIWITNSSGTFVKTLELWARQRLVYLKLFQQQTNRNSVDAVSSATLTSHRVHNATWNLKDVTGNVVPDGMYNIVIETSDHDTVSHTIPFMKGSAPVTLTPADTANYAQMSIKLQ
jgi:hypothetical protein